MMVVEVSASKTKTMQESPKWVKRWDEVMSIINDIDERSSGQNK